MKKLLTLLVVAGSMTMISCASVGKKSCCAKKETSSCCAKKETEKKKGCTSCAAAKAKKQ